MSAGVTPQVSVILPALNAERTLAPAIDSIRSQTLAAWELIIVDDGSSDGTAAIATAAANQDPRIRMVRQPHAGVVRALESGLAAARGEFVARMDADDRSLPGRLEAQLQLLLARPELGLVSCRVEFGGNPVRSAGYAHHVHWLNSLLTPEAIALNRFVEAPLAHPSVMFRKELLARHGGYREGAFPEDYELWLRWLEAGVRMAKVPETLFVWNDPPRRLSRVEARYAPEAFYAVKAPYLARAVRADLCGRTLWVWGAGRLSRRRVEALEAQGINVAGFIDIDPNKWGRPRHGREVRRPTALPLREQAMVVSYVASRDAREQIRATLERAGFVEGRDAWMAA